MAPQKPGKVMPMPSPMMGGGAGGPPGMGMGYKKGGMASKKKAKK